MRALTNDGLTGIGRQLSFAYLPTVREPLPRELENRLPARSAAQVDARTRRLIEAPITAEAISQSAAPPVYGLISGAV